MAFRVRAATAAAAHCERHPWAPVVNRTLTEARGLPFQDEPTQVSKGCRPALSATEHGFEARSPPSLGLHADQRAELCQHDDSNLPCEGMVVK